MSQNGNPKSKPSFWEALFSVLAAMFGVQSQKNRERDFTQGDPWVFIVIGVVMTVAFVLSLVWVVKMVLP